MSLVQAWILASRPKTLSAAAVPVIVGTAIALREGGARVGPALMALMAAFAIQIATNFANDLFDHLKGADTAERVGPTRAVQSGMLSPRAMAMGTAVMVILCLACGGYLAAVAGWPVMVVGVVCVLSGLAYTGGPFPLAYNGLGDVFVLAFFGFVAVIGTVWVQMQTVPALAVWASVPVGLLATGILVVNNIRDREGDLAANKRTVVARFGRTFGERELLACLVISYVVPVLMAGLGFGPGVLLSLASLPLAGRVLHEAKTLEGAPLNGTLAHAAQLLLVYGALFSVGLVAAPA